MRTIEEIKKDLMYIPNAFASEESRQEFILDLDELIETVTTLQREKCAEEAKVFRDEWGDYEINEQSILNAKL